jgi:hypothetical protein
VLDGSPACSLPSSLASPTVVRRRGRVLSVVDSLLTGDRPRSGLLSFSSSAEASGTSCQESSSLITSWFPAASPS